jgi:LmeA-like phospholipid-binding
LYNYPVQQQRRRGSRGRKVVIWLVVVLALLVGLDFGSKAFAESEAATQLQKQGFPTKPSVSIAGFPFLSQVVTKHFDQITITSSNIPAGPLTITSMKVTAKDVRINSYTSFSGGTTGPVNGSLFISLGSLGDALSAAGPLAGFIGGNSLKVVTVGSNEIKGSLQVAGGLLSWSATWKVTSDGPNQIDLHLVSSSGLPSGLLSGAQNVKLPLTSLPAGLTLTGGLTADGKGITAHVMADSLSFSA